jgi:hypothetical protein
MQQDAAVEDDDDTPHSSEYPYCLEDFGVL